MVARITIVRHGETEENRVGIMQGHLDTKLNKTGIRQAHFTADALKDVPFDVAFSSDLERAALTAQIILEKHPGVQLETQTALRERYLGDWQGHTVAERTSLPANAEQAGDFAARVIAWWDAMIVPYASAPRHDGRPGPWHILVVSHGGFVGTLVTNLMGRGRLRCADGVVIGRCWNASLSEIELGENGKGTVVRYADVSHIKEAVVDANADVQE